MAAYSNDPDEPTGPPTADAWVRFRQVPDDAALHAGLLAQFTGHMSIAAALRPHHGVSQDQAHRTLSMAINAINLSLYGPVQVDDWLLYHHHSTFAGAGTTHAESRVYDLGGALVASFTVDAMVRPLPSGAKGPMDARTCTVSLTTGRGPLSAKPAGRFTAPDTGTRLVHRTVPPARRRRPRMAAPSWRASAPCSCTDRDNRPASPSRETTSTVFRRRTARTCPGLS